MLVRMTLRILPLALLIATPLLDLKAQTEETVQASLCISGPFQANSREQLETFLVHCNEAIENTSRGSPLFTSLLLSRGMLSADLGDRDKALDDLTEIISLLTEDNLLRATVLTIRSMHYTHIGDAKRALDDANAVLSVTPDYWEAYYARGLANSRYGDLDKAIDDYTIFIKHFPDDPDGYNNRAYAFIRSGKLAKAQADIERAVVLAPKIGMYRHSLGEIQALRGDLEQARLSWITACHDTDQHVRYAWKRSLKKQGLYAGELDQSCGQELITAFEDCLKKRCVLATEDFGLSK